MPYIHLMIYVWRLTAQQQPICTYISEDCHSQCCTRVKYCRVLFLVALRSVWEKYQNIGQPAAKINT